MSCSEYQKSDYHEVTALTERKELTHEFRFQRREASTLFIGLWRLQATSLAVVPPECSSDYCAFTALFIIYFYKLSHCRPVSPSTYDFLYFIAHSFIPLRFLKLSSFAFWHLILIMRDKI